MGSAGDTTGNIGYKLRTYVADAPFSAAPYTFIFYNITCQLCTGTEAVGSVCQPEHLRIIEAAEVFLQRGRVYTAFNFGYLAVDNRADDLITKQAARGIHRTVEHQGSIIVHSLGPTVPSEV